MNEADVIRAAVATNTKQTELCSALDTVLPILRHMQSSAGMRFWISIGLGIAVSALEGFRKKRCPGSHQEALG